MPKKLIETTLPLHAINDASAYDKMPGIGKHPKNMHQWWARLPLPAARAVLFASIVNDPFDDPTLASPEERTSRRDELFKLIETLMTETVPHDSRVWAKALEYMRRDADGELPCILDPFCGGGSIPLEAQRLGLKTHGSDLNPVAVLITKALVEIPPKFAHWPPVNPDSKTQLIHSVTWSGARGLADDVRYYGRWMRREAEKRIGHLYPKVRIEKDREATVMAWLWARTVKCPNPACSVDAPLIRTFFLSTKKGREAWVRPQIDQPRRRVWFTVETTATHSLDRVWADRGATYLSDTGKKAKAKFRCLACESTITGEYVDREAEVGRMSAAPLAIVAEGNRARVYVTAEADPAQLRAVAEANELARSPEIVAKSPSDPARGTFAGNAQGRIYGFNKFADYFTPRQLAALTTFSDLVNDARTRILADASTNSHDGLRLSEGGVGIEAYADAVATYLAFAVDKFADYNCSLSRWKASGEQQMQMFGRQAIPMVWDFAESNPFSTRGISWENKVKDVIDGIEALGMISPTVAVVKQLDASAAAVESEKFVTSTDPPYYDNIGYADLSDFFYVWLRRSLKGIFPSLTSTLLTPKTQELIASPYRFDGSREAAKAHFESGFIQTFTTLREHADSRFPLTVYYAFKQAEDEDNEKDSVASTGWETMLHALLAAGFQVTATWPIRASQKWRMVSMGTNALATYIVLACRPKPAEAGIATRRQFIAALKSELPDALKRLQHSSIAAVDLAQAAIGPGMAVFSRYARVIEADGSTMSVRSALQLINQALDEVLSAQESEYDSDTQWAVTWFSQFGMSDAPFGEAETLSKAKNTSVSGLVESGILRAAKSKVQLVSRERLDPSWDPAADRRLTIWEVTQHLIMRLKTQGEPAAAGLLRKVGGIGEIARDLAYRLYSVCERRGWTEEAIAYNSLVVAWPEISRLASESQVLREGEQMRLG